ncbi:DUF6478 family protein [Falsirhodobacter halotolerans]|uniref:DUF6478 family protein n=1 Tax=Falsirhodobacter halotolerans TaxID=1146892 RepID=UPI001FD3DFDE|nr:DUF6478 family protein [Falsirhodobacter halotolerans]MCJ8140711.1 DUF6478 family protein [Falsirhodobacter halotolerans]
MASRHEHSGRIETFLHRRHLAWWSREADRADTTPHARLGLLRHRAALLKTRLEHLIRASDQTVGAAAPIHRPMGTDWSWRPAAWREEGGAGVIGDNATALTPGITLFHDCPRAEIALRQVRQPQHPTRPAFGVDMEVFGFAGSFLSLAIDLPPEAVQGLRLKHLVCLTMDLEEERPARLIARLNVRHGPNTEQVIRDIVIEDDRAIAEFDLAYTRMNETRVEKMWLDLIVQDPRMNRITLHDLTLTRRPRAEI